MVFDIYRTEYIHFYPISKLHLNDSNKETDFNIGSYSLLKTFSFIYLKNQIKEGTNFAAKTNIK